MAACLLLVFVAAWNPIRASAQSVPPTVPVGTGLTVAFADFDGDSQPDQAGVQIGRTGVLESEYWIQLELSAAGRRVLPFIAPSGGVQIAARDVNGDHFPDLVVTTAWLQRPVAVYLNDGHGGFSPADPAKFVAAFGQSGLKIDSTADRITEIACAPQGTRLDVTLNRFRPFDSPKQAGIVRPVSLASAYRVRGSNSLGRAPPLSFS